MTPKPVFWWEAVSVARRGMHLSSSQSMKGGYTWPLSGTVLVNNIVSMWQLNQMHIEQLHDLAGLDQMLGKMPASHPDTMPMPHSFEHQAEVIQAKPA